MHNPTFFQSMLFLQTRSFTTQACALSLFLSLALSLPLSLISGSLSRHLCLPVLPQVSPKVAVTRSITRFIFSASHLVSALPSRQLGSASGAAVRAGKKVLFFSNRAVGPDANYPPPPLWFCAFLAVFSRDHQHSSVSGPSACQ